MEKSFGKAWVRIVVWNGQWNFPLFEEIFEILNCIQINFWKQIQKGHFAECPVRALGKSDEDITPTDTNDTPQDDIQGPITRARARQLNLHVSSFLSNVYCESENRLLPNDLIVDRKSVV